MKKILSFLFVLLSTCLVLFSCSSSEDFSGEASSFDNISSELSTLESTDSTASEAEDTVSSPTEKNEYILNRNTKVFHRPSCFCIDRMSEKNKKSFEGFREDVLFLGYNPCGHCCP